MKTILAVVVIFLSTLLSGYCKAGGWFHDLMDRSSFHIQTGNAVYYHNAPPVVHYYQPSRPTIIYREPIYYAPPAPACGTYYYPRRSMRYYR